MESDNVYIIGEIGQNHNGSVDLAKLLVEIAARPIKENLFNLDLAPMNAVKLTKRDLKAELSYQQMNAAYNSPHSFGKTYGEHREYLELTDEEHFEVYKYAKSLGIDFVETLCAPTCTSIFRYFTPDKLKVASRDLTNLPLLEVLAETKVPLILSLGMAGNRELDEALETITKFHEDISILHCVSQYPTEPRNANLNSILYLKENYSNYEIGYSDHTIGISAAIAAVAMGARIIEKHITIDRNMKGTDQKGSLGIDGINRMVRDIRIMEESLGSKELFIDPSVSGAQKKLERSIASNCFINKGDVITEKMIHMLSPGDGFKWAEKGVIIGKKAVRSIEKNEIIYTDMISN